MQYGIGKLIETEREYQRALQVIPHVNRWIMAKLDKSKSLSEKSSWVV